LARIGNRRGIKDLFADGRAAAVAADQRVCARDHAVGKSGDDTAIVLREIGEGMREVNTAGVVGEHCGAQGVVEVRPMNLEIAGAVFQPVGIAVGSMF
jgi:hypothetical protein